MNLEEDMNSLWSSTVQKQKFPSLIKDRKTEVLIIGGGMAGVLCAYYLHQAGVPYLLVEGKTIGDGISKNTTAKITSQHGLIYHKLMKQFGIEKAKLYFRANEEAVQQFKTLCQQFDCDYEEKSAFVYSFTNREKIEQEVHALLSLGGDVKFRTQLPLPFAIAGAIQLDHQAQFHPLKFLYAISKGLNIYEGTFVDKIDGNLAITKQGIISANRIIVATHFPMLNTHGSYFIKMYQHRSYTLALAEGPKLDGMYVDEAMNGMSFRNHKDYLILGGGDHRTGKKGGCYDELREFTKRYYKDSREVYSWATQDCMTLDEVPYIGRYSKHTPNLFVATGFNKWGMTSSMVAAMLLTDMVQDKENAYAPIFSPSRSILRPQLFVNLFESTIGLLTPKLRRCTHLGCALHWNATEHTWDCSCHGSRFEESGKIIDNPAKKDAKV
jgi:glycine/D-amino acid oxidase-like deaminating enzyme